MTYRAIPKFAVDFVADQEGVELTAYQDVVGIWTIGAGHIEGVKKGDKCTRAQALKWLAADMVIAQRKLYGVLKPEIIDCLTEQQWAALLSFVFNLGAKKDWTIWKLLNDGKFDQAADQLSRFINAGGKKVQGLVNRRADEFKLWHSGDPNSHAVAVPSAVTREVGMTPPTPAAEKPLAQSKTLWAGGVVAAGGVVQGAQQVQALVAPQAANHEWLQKMAGFVAVVIVLAGIAIIVFKLLDQRAKVHQ